FLQILPPTIFFFFCLHIVAITTFRIALSPISFILRAERRLEMTTKVLAVMLAMSVCLVLTPNASSITEREATVADIINNPDKFNQTEVKVQGQVVQITKTTTEMGSFWINFFLVDANTGAQIAVEYNGPLSLQENALVTVYGDAYKKPAKTGFTPVIRANLILQ
ncbi:MAG TPA: hypothetical protein VIX18_06160, partial [Nitrospirota bacterium]